MHQRAASLAEIVASHELRVSTAPLLSASATAALPFGEAAVRASDSFCQMSRATLTAALQLLFASIHSCHLRQLSTSVWLRGYPVICPNSWPLSFELLTLTK